jgi:hypothetical protein
MWPNGEKIMECDIRGLIITIKPHVLMMVYNFMMNSFPEYDPGSKDKPSYHNVDPEQAPRLEFTTVTKDCILVL